MTKNRLARVAIIIICLYLIVTNVVGIFSLLKSGSLLTRRQVEVAKLQKEQEDLKQQIAIAQSPDYLQKIAYDKLGLSKPGEEIIIIPKELLANKNIPIFTPNTPNWQKWLQLLL